MYSGDSPSAARPNHHPDLLTAAADEAAGYTSRSPHRSPSQSPRKMAGMGRTRSKLDPESRAASQQPYMAAEPRALRRTPSRSRISWLLCADWASALTVWGSDERFRTTVLVNLTVRDPGPGLHCLLGAGQLIIACLAGHASCPPRLYSARHVLSSMLSGPARGPVCPCLPRLGCSLAQSMQYGRF